MSAADPTACVSDELLVRIATGAVRPDEAETLRDHVDDCPVCSAALLALIRASAPSSTTTATSTALPAGTMIGRFTLRDVLGSGNMGTVFTAWDPKLDRTVAIKVLRAEREGTREAERLLREAKAMAQVRHPNVVAVYEVGQDQDVVFVAMEQIRGTTLRARLADPALPLATRLGWLAQIARALGAIHGAGLIHRDLKPDNVFVEDIAGAETGSSRHRVVIGDFGLAAADTLAAERQVPDGLMSGTHVAGTPAYMAPEHLRGTPLDARADIFAFGITAWEVLTGARPFTGRTVVELEASILRGPARSPAFDALPAPINDVLVCCVAADRDKRPGSVTEIQRALDPAPRRRRARRRLLFIAAAATIGAIALAAALVVVVARGRGHAAVPVVCDAHARPRWETTRAPWIVRAQQLSPYVRDALVAAMDRRATAWSREAETACHRDVLAQQAWQLCRPVLEDLEQRVLAVAVERTWPDDQPLVQTLGRLPTPAYCGSSEAAEDAVALSALHSDAARASVGDGLGWLARADALDAVEAHAAADDALATASRIAASISPSPLDGELALARVKLRAPAAPADHIAALKATAATAERSGRASLIARSWLELAERAFQLDIDGATIDAALAQADWAISRLGDPSRLRARWLAVAGSRAWNRGDRDTAKAQFAKAATLAGADPDDRELAWTNQLTIAKLASIGGDERKTAEMFRALLADPEFVKHASAESQMVIESALAESLDQLEELAEAQQWIERAIETGRSVLPPDHPDQITNQMILAGIVLDRGDQKTALALLEEAAAKARASLGPDHLITGAIGVRIAQVLVESGRLDEGIAAAKDAAQIFEARQGRHSENGISARFLIADAYHTQGKLDASEKLFAEVLEDAEAAYGPTAAWAQLTVSYADLLVDLERPDEARPLLERAIPILEQGGSPSIAASGKFVLADIIKRTDLSHAVTLAKEAEAVWRGQPGWASEHGRVMAWLRVYAKR